MVVFLYLKTEHWYGNQNHYCQMTTVTCSERNMAVYDYVLRLIYCPFIYEKLFQRSTQTSSYWISCYFNKALPSFASIEQYLVSNIRISNDCCFSMTYYALPQCQLSFSSNAVFVYSRENSAHWNRTKNFVWTWKWNKTLTWNISRKPYSGVTCWLSGIRLVPVHETSNSIWMLAHTMADMIYGFAPGMGKGRKRKWFRKYFVEKICLGMASCNQMLKCYNQSLHEPSSS